MLLTGKFLRTLDDKSRFAIPKPLRDELGPENAVMYLAPGADGSLALYTQASFTHLAEQLATRSPTQQDVRDFSRLFYAQAQRVEIDRQGRVRLPAELASLASIKKEVVLLGVGDRLEIWDQQNWDEYLSAKQPKYDTIAENAFATGPAPASEPIASTAAVKPR